MQEKIKLEKIPAEKYSDYRYQVIFEAYKWDPQVEDANTVSEYVAVLDADVAQDLATKAEQLARETIQMETELLRQPKVAKTMGLPNAMCRTLTKVKNYQAEEHVRLMRFDFHPTTDGWRISEVNSDVPGGFAESSILPEIARQCIPNTKPSENFGKHLVQAFERRIPAGSTLGFVHATSYADDRQVMQFMGDYFEENGYHAQYLAPDHVKFKQQKAYSHLAGKEQALAGLIRFFPLEWMLRLPLNARWKDYYHTVTPSCNHPVAMLTQPKSLPLLWPTLTQQPKLWQELLPATTEVRSLDYENKTYIYKPVFGRVGGDITIQEATPKKEFQRIRKEALRHKKEWVVQERFESTPIATTDGQTFHLCLGVFVVDGEFAGFYGRISPYARIDEKAKDIPVLVKEEADHE